MRQQGKLLGIGLSPYVEICGLGPAKANSLGGGCGLPMRLPVVFPRS